MPNPGNANLPIGFFNPANQEIGDPRGGNAEKNNRCDGFFNPANQEIGDPWGKMRKRTTVVMAFITWPIGRLAIPGDANTAPGNANTAPGPLLAMKRSMGFLVLT